jgi:ATP-dependent DNA helicase DinG
LEPSDELAPVTAEDINALFRAMADRTDLFPAYERRAGQEQMAHVVAEHLVQGGHLAVEAGTGTGKSLAYLLPSLLHALRNDDRVVVSTHTLNLQDQLAEKDMPVARALVEAHEGGGELRTTVLKGRNNYLCLERWAQMRMDPSPRTEPEGRMFARISAWLPETETGDLGELYMTSQDRPAWDLVSAEDTDCLQRRCPYVRDGSCFLLRARQRAAAAHVVIVNHSLLLANAARDDQVLPGFRHLVIDEAHRLEDVATQHYGASVSVRDLRDLIDLIAGSGERRGGGFSIARRLQGLDGSAEALSPVAGLRGLAERLAQPHEAARDRVRDLGDAGRRFIEEHGDESGRGRREVSLTASRRAQPAWEDVEEAALQVDLALHVLEERLRPVREALADLDEEHGVEGLRAEAGHALEAIAGVRETLRRGVLRPSADDIGWLAGWEGDVRLHLAPLMVSELLATDLYAERESVAVTSATLTTAGSFDFTVVRLGLDHPRTVEIPSPYDYRRAVLALIAEDLPEPGMPGYDRSVHDTLIEAAIAAGGRTLALFTSHAAVRAAAQAVRDALQEHDILVLAQGVDGSPARLLRLLMERPRTLLIGTAAFWEGVDVQGDTLSQIVMARLPFPVPSDPIYAGRSEQYDDPFHEYAVPQAILRFRQGFGRLIRGTQDRGAFVVLDSRVSRRRYGELFLDALPDCEVRHLRADDIAMAVERWLE